MQAYHQSIPSKPDLDESAMMIEKLLSPLSPRGRFESSMFELSESCLKIDPQWVTERVHEKTKCM